LIDKNFAKQGSLFFKKKLPTFHNGIFSSKLGKTIYHLAAIVDFD